MEKHYLARNLLLGTDIVICDEGHKLKNATNEIYHAVSNLTTSKRVILTGTPIQNNVKECK